MRRPWPLAISLAVALAAGPGRVPGGVPLRRGGRGTEEEAKGVQQYVPQEWAEYPRPIRPTGPQPTEPQVAASAHPDRAVVPGGSRQEPRGNATGTPGWRLQIQNPLYPVTESSYGAYTVLLLALVLFAVGIVGNLAVMCIVSHSYYLKSAWNSILASLALWDFLVLFFCLPVIIFHEITKQRLLGDVSCRAVPFVEVSVCPARAHGVVVGGPLPDVGCEGVRGPAGLGLCLAASPPRQTQDWLLGALRYPSEQAGVRALGSILCPLPGVQTRKEGKTLPHCDSRRRHHRQPSPPSSGRRDLVLGLELKLGL